MGKCTQEWKIWKIVFSIILYRSMQNGLKKRSLNIFVTLSLDTYETLAQFDSICQILQT